MAHEQGHMLCTPYALLCKPHDPQNTSVPTVNQLQGFRERKVLSTWQRKEDKYTDNHNTWPRVVGAMSEEKHTLWIKKRIMLHVVEELWRRWPHGFLVQTLMLSTGTRNCIFNSILLLGLPPLHHRGEHRPWREVITCMNSPAETTLSPHTHQQSNRETSKCAEPWSHHSSCWQRCVCSLFYTLGGV